MNLVDSHKYPSLSATQISKLENQGCSANDWNLIHIHPDTDISLIRNVEFEGEVSIGLLSHDRYPNSALRNSLIANSSIGDGARIRYVVGGVHNAQVGDEVTIENCDRIEFTPGSACGVGTRVAVLDETGSREVIIYPGLSAQVAMLMARAKRSAAEEIYHAIDRLIDNGDIACPHSIGDRSKLLNCGPIRDVSIGHDITIESVRTLSNGAVINNAPNGKGFTSVGPGVDADGFIIEDGVANSGALLRNVYVGQGAILEKGFTAHDSLFFANCSMENGEACAVFAGPYSVSMHKGTLLIGCQTSFLNAGSSTNQSNHMYKLGPIHWGVLERGVKTSSGSYLMLGANIGAFSLLMGQHKTHPDSREFPFSYLFGDSRGATVVVPGVMLRSCGLLRDEQKWPKRDRRKGIKDLPMLDKVVCDVLNPATVDAMINALGIIRPMLNRQADDDLYHRYKGMKLSRASLDRAMKLYYLGIMKYLSIFLPSDSDNAENHISSLFSPLPENRDEHPEGYYEWVDVAGLPTPRPMLDEILKLVEPKEIDKAFRKVADDYDALQREWIDRRFPRNLRLDAEHIRRGAEEFDRLVELDRETYRASLSDEMAMLRL
ncbi:MAG: DUF4954 family protein [Muribaculaceae bacterium]|nr:DUF4954 family protein [Muribaculaceae bacterium]